MDKLDTLFSPERLREKWIPPNHFLKPNKSLSHVLPGYAELHGSLEKMINTRFSGESHKLLEALMNQLKTLLDLRFSATDKQLVEDEKITELNGDIDQALSHIEDLAEAFEMQSKGQ